MAKAAMRLWAHCRPDRIRTGRFDSEFTGHRAALMKAYEQSLLADALVAIPVDEK